MHIKKILVILLFVIQNVAFALPPIESCNMNGIWYMQTMPLYQFHVVQSGSSIIITTPTWPPEAQLNGAGSVTPSGTAFFYLEGRGKHTDVKGTFILLCSGMIWKMTDIFGEEEYTFLRTPIKIVEPTENDLIITSEPRMPNFNAKVVLDNLIGLKNDIPAYTWGIRIHHDIGSDMHINAYLDDVANDSAVYQPNFNSLKEIKKDGSIIEVPSGVIGGELTLSVDYYQNLRIEKKYSILKGTNPGQVAIEQVLTDKTLRQIACQESRYKQFIASREGGIGMLNTQSGNIRGGVGIMQLYDEKPNAAQVWNWRENIKQGIKIFNDKHNEATNLPVKELNRLNEDREALGLPACKNSLPSLTSEQLARETLRRYNCGTEYRWEPRDAPNCEGKWIQSPSCARDHKPGYDPKYVDNVLNCDINH